MSKYHIDITIKEEDGFEWRFIGMYGESKTEENERTWETLHSLIEQNESYGRVVALWGF